MRTRCEAERSYGLEPVETPEEIRQARGRLFRLPRALSAERAAEVTRRLQDVPNVERAGFVVSIRERSISFLTDELIVKFELFVTEDQIRRMAAEFRLESCGRYPIRQTPGTCVRSPLWGTGCSMSRHALLHSIPSTGRNRISSRPQSRMRSCRPISSGMASGIGSSWTVPYAWQALQDAGLQAFGEPHDHHRDRGSGHRVGWRCAREPGVPGERQQRQHQDLPALRLHQPGGGQRQPDRLARNGRGRRVRRKGRQPVAGGWRRGGAGGCRAEHADHGADLSVERRRHRRHYIWAAGFNPNSPIAGFPAPISPGASVFTSSFGLGAGAALSGTAKAMLDYVTSFGRGGKGCMCFFSTGNGNSDTKPTAPTRPLREVIRHRGYDAGQRRLTEIRAPYSGHGKIALSAPSHDNFPTTQPAWTVRHPGAGTT